MQEQEKQIKEMAKDLKEIESAKAQQITNETLTYVEEHHKYNPKTDYSLAHAKTIHELVAEEMIKLGYRKIDKDSVVLSKEKYKYLTVWFDKFAEIMHDVEKQSSKETAEKILREGGRNISHSLRDWIIEQFGVEIKD